MPEPQQNLRGLYYPADTPLWDRDNEIAIAAASGALAVIGDIAATTGTLLVCCDCSDRPVSELGWLVQCNNGWKYTLYIARANLLRATITLTDATAVDGDDTFILNGVTWTAKAANPVAADHEYLVGADNAATAANLAAALAGAYGPGVSAAVAPVAATDVITLSATTAPVLQFAQGASDANEIAWADTSLARLIEHTALSAAMAANTTNAGVIVPMELRGWPYAYLLLANQDGDAATATVGVIRY